MDKEYRFQEIPTEIKKALPHLTEEEISRISQFFEAWLRSKFTIELNNPDLANNPHEAAAIWNIWLRFKKDLKFH